MVPCSMTEKNQTSVRPSPTSYYEPTEKGYQWTFLTLGAQLTYNYGLWDTQNFMYN